MGVLFPAGVTSRADLAFRILTGGEGYRVIDHAKAMDLLWAVVERGDRRVLVCFSFYEGDGRWGYRETLEAEHPFATSCPRRLLEMAPVTCPEWREEITGRPWKGA